MSKSPLLGKVTDPMWAHHYSPRTEEAYVLWAKRCPPKCDDEMLPATLRSRLKAHALAMTAVDFFRGSLA